MIHNRKRDLCSGPILSNMILYALPLIATGLLQTLYNSADTAVIGRFAGAESLAAVSSTAKFINLLVNLFMGLSTGILTVVARNIGAKSREAIRKSVHTAIPLGLICGGILLVVGIFTARPILIWMGTGNGNLNVLNKAVLYTQIYFLGIPGLLLYNFAAAVLRAAGDTKRPLWYLTISGVTNVLLNLLFVIVFKWDVAGVALATILAQYVSTVLVVWRLMKEKGDIRFEAKGMCVDRQQFKEMLRIGVPSGINSSMFNVANVILQVSFNSFGPLYVAGSGAAGQIENLLYTAIGAFYTTTLAFTSQNFGARKTRRIRRVLALGHLINLVFCAVVCPIVVLFRMPLLTIFTTDPISLEAGSISIVVLMSSVVIDGAMNVQVAHLRGLGFSIVPMFNSMIGSCLLRILWVTLILPEIGHTWFNLYLCYPVTWLITALGHAVYTLYADRILKKFPDAEATPQMAEETV